jgi:hypothetical protein
MRILTVLIVVITLLLAEQKVVKTNHNYKEKNSSLWQKTYGGKDYDVVYSIVKTDDNGYLIAGSTESFGNGERDVYLIKIDKNGNKLWQKTYSGKGYAEVRAIVKTDDGGYLLVGRNWYFIKNTANEKSTVNLIKIDRDGNKLWEKTYGSRDWNIANAIIKTDDGGYLLAGSINSFNNRRRDVYLIKIDKNGNKLWQKIYSGKNYDGINAIVKMDDGSYLLAGYTDFSRDICLIKIDKNGNKLWQKIYGIKDWDVVNKIIKTDNGYLLAGYTEAFADGERYTYREIYLVRIDKNGNKLWQKTYSYKNSNIKYSDSVESIIKTDDGGYLLAGFTYSSGNGKSDVCLIKIDKNGNRLWQKTYGGKEWDEASSIVKTDDNGYLIVGSTESFGNGERDVYLIKVDKNGNTSNKVKVVK